MRGRLRTARNREEILAALTQGWSVHGATRQAGIGYRSYYDWRNDDPIFRAEADAAMEAATDLLEDEARRRAMDQSDLLLIFLLRSRRPHIYNRRQVVAVGGDLDNPLVVHQNGDPGEVVHFYMPSNGRDRPEEIAADEPPTIPTEGKAEDAA